MTDIEQQARKEAEEYCERVHPYAVSFGLKETIITCHAEALISERSKPSLMVGFSEEEIQRVALDLFATPTDDGDVTWPVEKVDGAVEALRYANTRAVSIDRIMEVVKEATWINDVDLLRERLMKMAALP